MQYLGVEYSVKHMPELDPDFIPFGVWLEAYAKGAEKPLTIALERDQGKISVRETKIHGTPEMAEADYRYVERYVKFLLWSVGGFRIWICGDSALAQRLQRAYTLTGERAFDVQFMQDVYEVPFEVIDCTPEQLPQANESSVAIGGHMEGCRIGFDAGRLRPQGLCGHRRQDRLFRGGRLAPEDGAGPPVSFQRHRRGLPHGRVQNAARGRHRRFLRRCVHRQQPDGLRPVPEGPARKARACQDDL